MIVIENEAVRATIRPTGAELTSLFHKQHKLEYMWAGDPAFWGKHSPVLFPIVGTLKENKYYYENIAYTLGRHGFARDSLFTTELIESSQVVFLLTSSADTKLVFPFSFEFRIHYRLEESRLIVGYSVINKGMGNMYFSIGGHPAFALPISTGALYSDYWLEFEKEETTGRWPISKDGLIEKASIQLLNHENQLFLTKELFLQDAIVLKNLSSSSVMLKSDKTPHGLRFEYSGFPYLGIWAAKNADFICIEPWCGIADPVDSDQQLKNKEGINCLNPSSIFSRSWNVELW